MKRTILFLFTLAAFGEDKPPKISDKTALEYKDAVIAVQGAQSRQESFWRDAEKAYADIQAKAASANQSFQAAVAKAQAECGAKHQLDVEALQSKGVLACIAKPIVAESELKK